MKKIIFPGIICLMIILQSCYDDYKKNFDYTAAYFALQTPIRTVIGTSSTEATLTLGVVLGGKYVNEANEDVYFEIDETMLDSTDLTLLPSTHYTLSNNEKFVIKEGEFLGEIEVNFTEAYLNDPLSTAPLNYALPIRLISTTLDSILVNQDSTVIAINYHNQFYGTYWRKGLDGTSRYNPEILKNKTFDFITVNSTSSIIQFTGADRTKNNRMRITVADNNAVTVSADTLTTFTDVSGSGTYNPEEKVFYLNYSYSKSGTAHSVIDTVEYLGTHFEVESWLVE